LSKKRVAIIGGGIAGISAALELSQYDLDIHLIEKDHFLGGKAINYNCKAADGRCRYCYACLVEGKLKELNRARNVQYHLSSRVLEFKNQVDIHLDLLQDPQFQTEKEQEVLRCIYNRGDSENLVLRGPSKNNEPLFSLDFSRIEEVEKDANSSTLSEIKKDMDLKSRYKQTLQVDAVILTTGFQVFNPERIGTYNYQDLDNVVSALDMEKIRKTRGDYSRPSDHKLPEKISFVQCVGSRSESRGNPWCSRVCCSYALKMAEAISAENPNCEITFFYMDIQNTERRPVMNPLHIGSGFRFIRMMPIDMFPGANSGVKIRYMSQEKEEIQSEEFDLTVLSVGMEPNPENVYIAKQFDKPLDRYGFIRENTRFEAISSEDYGVFAAGTATGPKNIPQSMDHATETVKKVMNYLSKQEKKDYAEERGISCDTSIDYRKGVDRHFHGK